MCNLTGFQDVMEFGRKSGHKDHNDHIAGWSPDTNSWDEKLYPAWKSGDARWENCWKGINKMLCINPFHGECT